MATQKNGYTISGHLLLNGKPLVPGTEKSIQPVFQDPGLYFNRNWTMQQCLEEPFYFKGLSKEIAQKPISSTLKIFSSSQQTITSSSKVDNFALLYT